MTEIDITRLPDTSRLRGSAMSAVAAIVGLWDATNGTFWRSTRHRERESAAQDGEPKVRFFPTVALRSTESLLGLVEERPDWCSDELRALLREEILPAVAAHEHTSLQSSIDTPASPAALNIFTLSIYVQTLSRICSQNSICPELAPAARSKLLGAAKALLEHTDLTDLASVAVAHIHPFLIYHATKAAASTLPHITGDDRSSMQRFLLDLNLFARVSSERLLTRERLGGFNPAEAIALAFCAATLSITIGDSEFAHIRESLTVCLSKQDPHGSWPVGRVVAMEKDISSDRIEIPTYEVASVLAQALTTLLEKSPGTVVPDVVFTSLDSVARALEYMDMSLIKLSDSARPRVGWCSDHAYGIEFIESWTSAAVLNSVLSIQSLCDSIRRRMILRTFSTVSPHDLDWSKWLNWERYKTEGEIDHEHPVLGYIDKFLVQPIVGEAMQRGDRALPTVSALLFGPPGTSKTTIVKGIADGLGWPLVMLSPGNFIERGLELIEAEASSAFGRLLALSKAVVIFDECDELFRDRNPSPDMEQARSISAFVTASMLPKLQALHDRRRVLFFICTNHYESIDGAVKRGGRIDHVIGVGPPDLIARRRIVEEALTRPPSNVGSDSLKGIRQVVVEELATSTERFTRNELQLLVRAVVESGRLRTEREARVFVQKAVEVRREGLVISVNEYERFREQRRRFSHPFLAGGEI